MGAAIHRRRRIAVAAGCVALIAAAIPAASADVVRHAAKMPKVIQLSYDVTDGSSGPKYLLSAFARRTDSLRFTARYAGRTPSATARYNDSVTDTDLNGEASHPWRPIREQGGKRVLKLIRRSLDDRGTARVVVHAKGNGGSRRTGVLMVLSECSLDPPLYPVTCEFDLTD